MRLRHQRRDLGRDDPTGVERGPQPADVGRRGEDPAVAQPAHGQVEHVRPQALVVEVADRGVAGQLVAAEERGLGEPGRLDHELVDEPVVRRAGGALGQRCEHDERGVVVREPLARGRHLRVPVERDP